MRQLPGSWSRSIPYFVIFAWASFAGYLSSANPTIGNSDMFATIPRAEWLSLQDIRPWVNGFYPCGYPLVLKALAAVVEDYTIAGRIISLVSGVVGLVAVTGFSRAAFGPNVALLAVFVICTNPTYTKYATIMSTDMPQAALLILAIYFFSRSASTGTRRGWILTGATLGLAYLVRYTALTVLPAFILAVWLQPGETKSKRVRLARSLWILGGFVLLASPQLLLSLISKGNPFYNQQAQNVYFGIFGGNNWGLNMLDARSVRSLWEVVSTHPSAFLHNWYYNLLRLPRLELVQFPLELVAYAGMVFSLGQRIDNRASTVMFLSFTAFSGAICMAFANERLLLFPGMLLCIFGAYGILAFVPRGLTVAAGRSLPLQKLLLILLCVWLIWVYVRPPLLDPLPQKDADRIRVAHTLKDDGVSDSSAVLSMSFDYYDLSSRTKDRYSIPWYGGGFETYKSVSDIASRMRLAKQTHLVFDDTAHRKVRGLKDIWPLDPVQLREHFDHLASFSGSVQVYRLRPLAGGGVER